MPMNEKLEKSGSFLLRYRSYLPLIFFLLFFAQLGNFRYPYGDHGLDLLWEVFCVSVGLLGMAIRIAVSGFAAEGTSGRGTERPKADSLNTTGPYSVVRNPLYLGNFFVYAAPVIFMREWSCGIIFVLAFAIYYERIVFAEEAFLKNKFGKEYMEWAAKTPAFVPKLSGWARPDLPFSAKRALAREYHGVYGLLATMFALETLADYYLNGALVSDYFWLGIFIVGTLFYLSVRFLHKRTQFLAVGASRK
jgi:protein-S-isoprenylcysteine O-methyltransferase Ste14